MKNGSEAKEFAELVSTLCPVVWIVAGTMASVGALMTLVVYAIISLFTGALAIPAAMQIGCLGGFVGVVLGMLVTDTVRGERLKAAGAKTELLECKPEAADARVKLLEDLRKELERARRKRLGPTRKTPQLPARTSDNGKVGPGVP